MYILTKVRLSAPENAKPQKNDNYIFNPPTVDLNGLRKKYTFENILLHFYIYE